MFIDGRIVVPPMCPQAQHFGGSMELSRAEFFLDVMHGRSGQVHAICRFARPEAHLSTDWVLPPPDSPLSQRLQEVAGLQGKGDQVVLRPQDHPTVQQLRDALLERVANCRGIQMDRCQDGILRECWAIGFSAMQETADAVFNGEGEPTKYE